MTQTGVNENYGKVLYELGISGTDVDQMDASLRRTPKLGWALDNPVISRRQSTGSSNGFSRKVSILL